MTTIDSSAEAYTSIDDLSVQLADGVLAVTDVTARTASTR